MTRDEIALRKAAKRARAATEAQQDLKAAILAAHKSGMTPTEIARATDYSRQWVHRVLASQQSRGSDG